MWISGFTWHIDWQHNFSREKFKSSQAAYDGIFYMNERQHFGYMYRGRVAWMRERKTIVSCHNKLTFKSNKPIMIPIRITTSSTREQSSNNFMA